MPGSDKKIEKVSASKLKVASLEKVRKQLQPLEKKEAIKKILDRNKGDLPQLEREEAQSIQAMRVDLKRYHGLKIPITWFPWWRRKSPCADKFGYLTSAKIRKATRLSPNATTRNLLEQLGQFMGDPSRGEGPASTIPAGFTYFGQFVDHDITLDVSSDINGFQSANNINNMRSPMLDLDSVYGQGPAVDPYLYQFPNSGPPSAVKLLIGTNQNVGVGGPGSGDGTGPMAVQLNSDLPRAPTTNTALLGDPRNDENLIVSQLHHAVLKFHNAVVDSLVSAGFTGDVFLEAKKIVTHHYQWAVVHDFLTRICGASAVNDALTNVTQNIGSGFRMPVEFAVGAYRFGHSMVREEYWLNAALRDRSMGEVFSFIRNPLLPVFSNWVIEFNAFFETGFNVAKFNHARQIDSVLAPALDMLPGFSGLMAILASRNLLRGVALGLPSGQGVAKHYGLAPLTDAQLKQGLPAAEQALLDSNSGLLLKKTPLWYYVLREAKVKEGGNQLGLVGGRIVAETFARMLKRDENSYLNASPAFTPTLASANPGTFTVADMMNFSGVTVP